MEWEVGDYFRITRQDPWSRDCVTPGKVYEVLSVDDMGLWYRGNSKGMYWIDGEHETVVPAILDNKLNRKLYPNYVKKSKFLVPKDGSAV